MPNFSKIRPGGASRKYGEMYTLHLRTFLFDFYPLLFLHASTEKSTKLYFQRVVAQNVLKMFYR